MRIEVYKPENKTEWDNFVRQSKNGTFLFCRDFMEYHAHRFTDLSFLFYNSKDELISLLPGNRQGKDYYSHQGLTYGGLIMSTATTAAQVLEMFELLVNKLRSLGLRKIVYKAVPHIYHKQPSEEDLYALFRNKAQLIERNLSSTISLSDRIAYARLRNRGMRKAQEACLVIEESNQIGQFWKIVTNNMQRKYKVSPVHNTSEIEHLMSKFPDNIQLLIVRTPQGEIQGGCLNFITDTVVHAQYAAATEEGKSFGALDLLIDFILSNTVDQLYFDFGISNENHGLKLNEKLIFQKEGFGARGIAYDIYTMPID